jgi:hypothetical protein
MDDKGLPFHNDGMTGIISTLKPDHYVCEFGQEIYYLALALITPLSSYYYHIWHVSSCASILQLD